ncbi:MAG: hypothetical protein C4557_11280 [Anaerolineaceae bacterium]|jgi:hypothetical protein|nr:MAG: hypothetical protein C4557_11280 [Anaerolineaceae bacterium]
MDENRIWLGILVFVVLVVGANLVMYAMVRGAFRSGGRGGMETMFKSIQAGRRKKENELDELRRTVQQLDEGRKDPPLDSE